MGLFKNKVETVSQIHFVEEMTGLLDTATDANTDIKQVVENAHMVRGRLSAIHAGKLAVEPPLSHEQFTDFEGRAETVITIGKKAASALNESAESRKSSKKSSGDEAKFSGSGTGRKG